MFRQKQFQGTVRRPWILAAALLFSLVLSCPAAEEVFVRPVQFDDLIEKISAEYELNPLFVQAMIWRESRFNARAKGSAGEIGLMQVRMCTVEDWAKAHRRKVPAASAVYDPELNLRIGIWRLDQALRNWEGYPDQTFLALYEYNAGRKSVLRALAHCDGEAPKLMNSLHQSAAYAKQITAKFEEYVREQEDLCEVAKVP